MKPIRPIKSIAQRNYERERRRTAKAGAQLVASVSRCQYCRRFIKKGDPGPAGATVDHLRPLIQGGTSARSNLVVACRSCNSTKSFKTPAQAAMVPK